jgi:hypothetical protein
LILSRKGVDSSAGGFASPIFPDGSIWSVPIPDPRSPLRYRDLNNPQDASKIVHNLSRGRVVGSTRVHMDPDLAADTLPRAPGWRGIFGQHGAAQRHLQLQGVQPGDLFLFFGWFRQVQRLGRRWYYVADAPDIHLIFGWLQVGAITPAAQLQAAWAQYHPHFHGSFGVGNSLYTVTREPLRWAPGHAAAGVFDCLRSDRVLTAPGCTRSIWQLPGWFDPRDRRSALSYHTDVDRWSPERAGVRLRTAARGQEFVLDLDHFPEAHDWISGLFRA